MARPKIEGTGHGLPVMSFGSDGEHWYAIHVDDDGRPHVVVEVNALPGGAATAANQAAIAALIGALTDPDTGTVNKQLLQLVTRMGTIVTPAGGTLLGLLTSILADTDDIPKHANFQIDATTKTLAVASDKGDKIFSMESVVAKAANITLAGGSKVINSPDVDSGKVWKITTIFAMDATSACTQIFFSLVHDAVVYGIFSKVAAMAAGDRVGWSGEVCLDADDYIQCYFVGGQNDDDVYLDITGYEMNAP